MKSLVTLCTLGAALFIAGPLAAAPPPHPAPLTAAPTASGANRGDQPASACQFFPTGPLTVIVKGAHQQHLELLNSCSTDLAGAVTITLGNTIIRVKSQGNGLDLFDVPSDLAVGSGTWQVSSQAGAPLGTLTIPVAAITVADQLAVRYDHKIVNDLQDGLSAKADGLGIAVVGSEVQNVATLRIPQGVPASSDAGFRFKWNVTSSTWQKEVIFDNCSGWDENGIVKSPSSGCSLDIVSRLAFRAVNRVLTPLTVQLSLLGRRLISTDRGVETVTYDIVLLDIDVSVAARSRSESVPLRIGQALSVKCTKDSGSASKKDEGNTVFNGETVPINPDIVSIGMCTLQYDQAKLPEDLRPLVQQFGPQLLDVTVHREGAENATDGNAPWLLTFAPPTVANQGEPKSPSKTVDINDASAKTRTQTPQAQSAVLPSKPTQYESFPLPLPSGQVGNGETYLVLVKIKTQSTDTFVYRSGSIGATDAASGARFSARLKMKDLFAWPTSGPNYRSIRMFVTVPVSVTSFRFPASPLDMKSSSAYKTVEPLAFKAGVLLGVEPWDYRTGKDYFAVPVRVFSGFHLLNLTEASFAPTWLLGGAITLPVIESKDSITDTALALGVFWEVDLRQSSPISQGSHLLVTLGFNALAIGSPKK